MRTFDVRFTHQADADFDSILHFIAQSNPHRAISFVDELQQRLIAVLSIAPNAGTQVNGYRYTVLGRYVAVYTVDADAAVVQVVLIAEGHRDWRKILKGRS